MDVFANLGVMGRTLLVLAAGMGSRYGGLKQIDPVGPSGEVLLDYSVFDAINAGFDRIVFVIRRDFEDAFRESVVSRYAGSLPVEIAFQELGDLPAGLEVPSGRTKPWGTGHAIWAARHAVDQPFLVINADDFYGANAFAAMADFLGAGAAGERMRIGLVAYLLRNTLSEHGTVSRGICTLGSNHELKSVEEYSGIEQTVEGIRGLNAQGHPCELSGAEMASMNFWGFLPDIFPQLETLFHRFLTGGGLDDPKAEFYIPSAVSSLIATKAPEVTALTSTDQWLGVTYREDREAVAEALSQRTAGGLYPTPLWKSRT
jgi:hypothetical protein